MESIIRLFKALPIEKEGKRQVPKEITKATLEYGFIFSPQVAYNYTDEQLNKFIPSICKEIGISKEQMNSSFHKSWIKVRDASIEQLVFEQILHYITTYGFEFFNVYSEDTIYIPSEELNIPNISKRKFPLIVIKGYTKNQLKSKLLSVVGSGIALKDETKNDIMDVYLYTGIKEEEIYNIKNKEVRCILYSILNLVPENPVEFLRYGVYLSTNKTLLIKDKATIGAIKQNKNFQILGIFNEYKNRYGFERLAEIFFRFKPLFLAFKTNSQMNNYINKIRKLADRYHKPMPEDYLNTVTSRIKRDSIDEKRLQDELDKVNIFRKARLAYALKYRSMQDINSILYRIRNGKSYATSFDFKQKDVAEEYLDIVLDSIANDLKPKVKGKKIYIPDNVVYGMPSSEKQFTGEFPLGSYISIPKNALVGVHWEDVNGERIDLDLKMVSIEGAYGWDGFYRDGERQVLFSGDMTAAPKPNGASEYFYIKKSHPGMYLITLNFYNYMENLPVPFHIILGYESNGNFIERGRQVSHQYMINPNSIVCKTKSIISEHQKILGILMSDTDGCRFYFSESYLGNNRTSKANKYTLQARDSLIKAFRNPISLNDILVKAGAKLVSKDKCDIDLSPESLEKDTIINLFKKM